MGHSSLTPKNFEKLLLFIENHSDKTDGLMPILHEAQDIFWLYSIRSSKVYF